MLFSGSDDRRVQACDSVTGKLLWTNRMENYVVCIHDSSIRTLLMFFSQTCLVFHDNQVFVAVEGWKVATLNAKTGKDRYKNCWNRPDTMGIVVMPG